MCHRARKASDHHRARKARDHALKARAQWPARDTRHATRAQARTERSGGRTRGSGARTRGAPGRYRRRHRCGRDSVRTDPAVEDLTHRQAALQAPESNGIGAGVGFGGNVLAADCKEEDDADRKVAQHRAAGSGASGSIPPATKVRGSRGGWALRVSLHGVPPGFSPGSGMRRPPFRTPRLDGRFPMGSGLLTIDHELSILRRV